MVTNARQFSIAVAALGVMVFALGGMAAWAQTTSSGSPSLVIVDQPPASGSAPSIPRYQIVTPGPGTGSIVVMQQVPIGGSGVSMPQYQLVIPGPNPAQNTPVSVGQQLSTMRGTTVTVYTVPTL